MSTLGAILLAVWLVVAIVVGALQAREIYRQPNPAIGWDQIRGGNPRTAVACGVVLGLSWPIQIVIAIGCIFTAWLVAGQREPK